MIGDLEIYLNLEINMVKEITCPGRDFTRYVQDSSQTEFRKKVLSFPSDKIITRRLSSPTSIASALFWFKSF